MQNLYTLVFFLLLAVRRLAKLRQQQLIITGLSLAYVALALIVALVVWGRKRIAEKNRGLYRQIKEQDNLKETLQQLTLRYDALSSSVSQPAQENESIDKKQQELVAKLQDYLLCEKIYTKFDIDHKELTSALATNKTYLFDSLKNITGKTPQEYINDLRLDDAKKMIYSYLRYTMETIAIDCGFNSYRTFHRLFKKKYQLSPAAYSKLANSISVIPFMLFMCTALFPTTTISLPPSGKVSAPLLTCSGIAKFSLIWKLKKIIIFVLIF
ncbi:MAG: helix-turn-helix domain-containing protein [Prevotellaceae bacterium]|jgi:AraC-like DNA-binding protein|nr:helix-turn-helix domain-containing protein [Prevotellaceae bacterium]